MKTREQSVDGETVRSSARSRWPEIRPHAVEVARRFHPEARRWVITVSSRDHTGRMADLARVCPGAHLLAFESMQRGPPFDEVARHLLGGVEKGLQLDRVLLGSTRELLSLLRRRSAGLPIRQGPTPLPGALPPGGRPWRAADPVRLRLLVRRASARVNPADLWGPPSPAFSPEDIPCDRTSGRWYATMRLLTDLAGAGGHAVPPCTWSFFSRRAVALADMANELAGGGAALRPARAAAIEEGLSVARAAFTYFEETGAWPHRDSDVWDVARKMVSWWDGKTSVAFPSFDVPLPGVDGVALEPIATGSELRDSATRLQNCLAGYHAVLKGGRCWVFTGTLLGREVAAEVRFTCGRYVVAQVSGPRNDPISREQRSLLRVWVARLNRRPPTRRARPGNPDGIQSNLAL
jgi:hypothetical protein